MLLALLRVVVDELLDVGLDELDLREDLLSGDSPDEADDDDGCIDLSVLTLIEIKICLGLLVTAASPDPVSSGDLNPAPAKVAMMKPGKVLQTPDWYGHDGPHKPISVALGASIGYWFGQPGWKTEGRRRRRYDPMNVPMAEVYHLDRVDDCCSEYGFRKGYRFRTNDYSDRQSEEEIRRFNQTRYIHIHNPLAVARGAVIGFAYGRAGKIEPYKTPDDLIRTCCAGYGFWEGFRVGHGVFFENATKAERTRYLDAYHRERWFL